MADREREIERLAAWVESCVMPRYEVRVGREIIETVEADDDTKGIASQLVDIIDDDFDAEKRRRQYRIVGLGDDGQQYVCPLKLYRRPDGGGASDAIVAAMSRQVTDLHSLLLKRDEAHFSRSNKTIEMLSDGLHRALDELSRGRERQEEFYTKLETLRTEQLERDIIKERHEKNQELLERGVDTVLPLVMAGASMAFNGAAKPMLTEPTLVQIAKGMQEGQLDSIRDIIGGEVGSEIERFLVNVAISGSGDVDKFRVLLGRIPQDKLLQVYSVLNPGQQAAVRSQFPELLPS